eukprot:gnl/MRDRNA2_/MRDRNA2_18622_c0_seq1.p1 gnl/MRDRNA2_/MRDRNA2_18622_c0~~gnl/MRDRNA2_/MRDRNA2_18622_c0_seq1.p1  ORF type:complete len:201 (-),score=32.68 gnl/MRDRNA2_/MRDRNA2_18622_c0_seq1:45-647(-)
MMMISPKTAALAILLVAMRCHGAYHAHMTDIEKAQKGIPVVEHKKVAGNGYEKGSPLYKKQQSLKKHSAPPPPEGRQKPSLAVIFGFLFVGFLVLILAAFINKRELVWYIGFPEVASSQSRLQPPPSRAPVETSYLPPQQAPVEYVSMPSSGVVYVDRPQPGAMSPTYATMPPPNFGTPPSSMGAMPASSQRVRMSQSMM